MSSYRHHHTHLTSQNVEKAVEFYTKVMNAKITKVPESGGPQMVDIDLGGIQFGSQAALEQMALGKGSDTGYITLVSS